MGELRKPEAIILGTIPGFYGQLGVDHWIEAINLAPFQ